MGWFPKVTVDGDVIHMRSVQTLPPITQWCNRPMVIVPNTKALKTHIKDDILPMGVPVPFETDLFKGRILFRVRGCGSIGDGYFDKRNRKWQGVVQGQFKEPFAVSKVSQGGEFCRPFKNMPPNAVVRALEKAMYALSPHGNSNDFTSKTPRVMSCIGSMAKTISVAKEGQEVDITDWNLPEDCKLFGGRFQDGNISATQRRKILSDPKNGFEFNTEYVYTIEYYDHLMDIGRCQIDLLGIARIKTASIFDGQPMSAVAKADDGRYLWNFQLWHELNVANAPN